jgi:hypothetical protein
MWKQIKLFRLGVLLLIGALATNSVFFTSAKYVSAGAGQAAGRVAKFEVRVNPTAATSTIFPAVAGQETILTAVTAMKYGYGASTGGVMQCNGGGAAGVNVSATQELTSRINPNGGTIFAPGVGGRFEFVFTNYSEVAVRVWLDSLTTFAHIGNTTYNISTANMQFSRDNATGWGTLANALGSATANYIDLAPNTTVGAAATTRNVYWRWRFDINSDAQDTADTRLGETAYTNRGTTANVPGIQLVVKFRANQID